MEVFFVGTPIPHFGSWMYGVFYPRCVVGLCLWWDLLYLEFLGDEDTDGFGLEGYVQWIHL